MSRRCREWPRLTDEQREYATDHHNLIYLFLHQRGFDIDEWYDVAAEAYLKAVISHDPQRGVFSSFAFLRMRHSIYQEMRLRNSQCRSALQISIEEMIGNYKEPSFDEDFSGVFASNLLQHLTDREQHICKFMVAGYMKSEIADLMKVSCRTIYSECLHIRQKLKEAIAE